MRVQSVSLFLHLSGSVWLTSYATIKQTHEQLYDFMRKRDLGFDVEKEFNSPGLFMGSVVTLQVWLIPH